MVKELLEKFNDNVILITIVSIFNKLYMLGNKLKLQKDKQIGNVIILDAPPITVKHQRKNMSKKYKDDAKMHLAKFTQKIEQNISKQNLIRMYNNLVTLKLEERNLYLIVLSKLRFPFSKGIIAGGYFVGKNKMTTYSRSFLEFIKKFSNTKSEITIEGIYSHELLHMSSSSKSAGKWCIGFHHHYAPFNIFTISSIGMGINEGYTELLNERIFGEENKGGIYDVYKETARIIESVIGRERMTDMYFSNDLNGLVEKLSIYIPAETTKRFILELDGSLKNYKNMQFVFDYLLLLMNRNLQENLKNNVITRQEALHQYDELKKAIEKMTRLIYEIEKRGHGFIKPVTFDINYNNILETCNRYNKK